jgi:phosphinothricin acetyltransferase
LTEQQRWIEDRAGAHAVLVAEEAGRVAGFASLSPYRDRPAYATSVEDSVYVHADFQGAGVGRLLLAELIEVATVHGFHAMFARIAGGDVSASQRLHESLGFEVVGTEREVGRKFGRWLDVVVMERLL